MESLARVSGSLRGADTFQPPIYTYADQKFHLPREIDCASVKTEGKKILQNNNNYMK
jgi:hypothetical protein